MISYVEGKLIEINDTKIVVETGGIGFDIFFPLSNIKNLPDIGNNIKVYTYMNVKEDEMSLYGFLSKDDKEMFLKLLTVNGVGPKGALHIISSLGFAALMNAIANDDSKLISSVQGIGSKTASKICIELGDKVRKLKSMPKLDSTLDSVREEVIEALKKLGYKEIKARELVAKVDIKEGATAGQVLREVL